MNTKVESSRAHSRTDEPEKNVGIRRRQPQLILSIRDHYGARPYRVRPARTIRIDILLQRKICRGGRP